VLAKPVIALGLPTLVLLNMADVFAKGGGSLDVLKLATELGTPVAMVSATQGTGLDAVDRFLRQDHDQRPSAIAPSFAGSSAEPEVGESGWAPNRLPTSTFPAYGAAGWTMCSYTKYGDQSFL